MIFRYRSRRGLTLDAFFGIRLQCLTSTCQEYSILSPHLFVEAHYVKAYNKLIPWQGAHVFDILKGWSVRGLQDPHWRQLLTILCLQTRIHWWTRLYRPHMESERRRRPRTRDGCRVRWCGDMCCNCSKPICHIMFSTILHSFADRSIS